MGNLVFQATLGGQVNLVGPNTASTFNINVPTVNGDLVTTGDTGTVTNTMLAGSIANNKLTNSSVTIGSTSVSLGATASTISGLTLTNPTINGFTGDTSVVNIGSGQFYKDTSGNVGIGTSSPSTRLHVSGGGVSFQGSGYPSSGAGLEFQYNAPTGTIGAYDRTGSAYKDFRLFGSTIQFEISGNEKARIDSSGHLLVNTTTSGGWSGDQTFSAYATGSSLAWAVSAYNSTTSNGGAILSRVDNTSRALAAFYYTASTNVGNITTNGTGTTYATSSDYRLKENVQPMVGALSVVAALKPCTYTWKADGSDGQGFIAHELQAVVPDCVTGEKDAVDADGNPVYQGIDTSFLVATLTAAIQEQQAIIEQLQADVEALKAPK